MKNLKHKLAQSKIVTSFRGGMGKIGRIPFTYKLLTVVLLLGASYVAVFYPKSTVFSYSSATCQSRTTFLPELFKSQPSDSFDVELVDSFSIAGYPVVSRGVCFTAQNSPKEGEQSVSYSLFGSPLFSQSYSVQSGSLAKIAQLDLDKVAVSRPLTVPLTKADTLFDYKLAVGGKTVECTPEKITVSCDVEKLQLTQGAQYTVTIERYFNDKKQATLVSQAITTLEPVVVIDTSIKPQEQVFAKPADVFIKTDKKIVSAKSKLELIKNEAATEVGVTATAGPEGVQVVFGGALERSADYRLTLFDVEAEDGSTLLADYVLPFKMSGGPKVTGINIGATGVALSATVVVSFDQPLSNSQGVAAMAAFGGGAASLSKNSNQIIFRLNGLQTCSDFSITISKDILSAYDIPSGAGWSFASRTICHTISTIGYSVKGRPINAYYFGNGATKILFTGAIHGSEKSSKYIMDRWITELESKARSIPGDRQIIVIPAVNPDGFASSQRYNANNINLNRNFPTANWTSNTPVAGGRTENGAGGSAALSEPEARSLANFTMRLQPRLVVTYHSQGSIVNSNDAGISIALGQLYARMTGYQYISNANTNATFDLEMTGTYEDWLLEKGVPAILLELNTNTGDHFNLNKAAMWEMVKG